MCVSEGDRESEASMALEAAVVYPPQDYPFGYAYAYAFAKQLSAPHWPQPQEFSQLDFLENQTHNYDWNICSPQSPPSMLPQNLDELQPSNPQSQGQNLESSVSCSSRPKRRRAKTRKNKEEIENQRMTHIAVERNRRKQMNEYLSVLRSLMPHSYVQRGDQASIIGGAINFVKELEQRVQFLGTGRDQPQPQPQTEGKSEEGGIPRMPFSEFFSFPQYSSCSSRESSSGSGSSSSSVGVSVGDIEVTMVESHANIKIRTNKRPRQLLKVVSALHSMRLTILHLNVTTTHHIVLYSISVKLEEECKMGSVDDIAAAVHQMLLRIQQESSSMLNQDPNFN